MKRNLGSLITLFLSAAFIAGCTTGNTSPIQSGTDSPRDGTTVSVETPHEVDPIVAATRTPESPSLPTEIPIPLKPGFGETDNERDEFMNNTVEGRAQRDWLIKWLGYWSTAREEDRDVAPVELRSDISRLYFKKFPGSNMLVFESPDYPNVVIVPPTWAQEGMLPPPDVQPNHAIPAGSNILTLSTTSGPELVQFGIPEGSVLVPRNGRYFFVDQKDSSRAVGMVNIKTGQWEAVDFSQFNYCGTRREAKNCRIDPIDVENGSFANFARFHDTTNFTSDVRIEPLRVMAVPPSFNTIDWLGDPNTLSNIEIKAWFEAHPDKLPSQRVAYGVSESSYPGYDFLVTVVKQIDMVGRVSFLTYIGASANNVVNLNVTFPLVEVFVGNRGYTDPEVVPLLHEWIDTGIIPPKLESKVLHEYNEQK